jgi:hypothetical protein
MPAHKRFNRTFDLPRGGFGVTERQWLIFADAAVLFGPSRNQMVVAKTVAKSPMELAYLR